MSGLSDVRIARQADVSALTAIATAAYAIYLERMDREPAPMIADFAAHVERGEAYVLEDEGEVVAFIITYARKENQFIENVAVRPSRQGQGHGKMLLEAAEQMARSNGQDKVVLYTNLKMSENLAFYPRLGYVEMKRVSEDGFERVYFEKRLTP